MHIPRVAPEKPSVGDKGNFLAHPLPVDQRGDAQHFAHARTTDGTFIADHQDLARSVVAATDRADATLFILEYARDAFEREVFSTLQP